MSQIDDLQERIATVRQGYAAAAADGWGELGPVDPDTGERWDRGNVLGHVAEMLPYWTGQVREVLGGAGVMGRDDAGTAERRAAIDGARAAGLAALLRQVDEGLGGVGELLAGMRDEDLARPVTYRSAHGPEQASTLGAMVETVLVRHAEEHLRQLGPAER